MRIVCISDTHEQLGKFDIPDGDVLIHAGDLTRCCRRLNKKYKLEAELRYLNQLPHKHKIWIAGNHEFICEDHPSKIYEMLRDFPTLTYLQDSSCTVNVGSEKMVIYGSPWQPVFHWWAFNLEPEFILKKWQQIPENVDVLVTHGPPLGILDSNSAGKNCGCEHLRNQILERIRPRLHVFGHIHVAYGATDFDNIKFVNAAICDGQYTPVNKAIVVDL